MPLRTADVILVGGYHFLEVFGIPQSLLIYGSLLALAITAWAEHRAYLASPRGLFHLANVGLWASVFWGIPYKAEHLLPMVPSVVLLVDRMASTRLFAIIFASLISYNVVSFDLLGGESGVRRIEPSVKPGYLVRDVEARRFHLWLRETATHYVARRPTVLMMDDFAVATNNPAWVLDKRYGLYRQRNGNLYMSTRILEEARLKQLRDDGVRMVAWRGRKWEYLRTHNTFWQNYVEVVNTLEQFFGVPQRGRPFQ
jgi:hypothetical protein